MRSLSSVVKQPIVLAASFAAFVVFVAACGSGNGGDGDGAEGGGSFGKDCEKSDEKQFAAAPDLIIDTSKSYVATISTERGDIVLELFSDVPITTNNFVFLACKGYYDGVTFHDEDDGEHGFDAGVISMAKSGADTTGSQFFITYTPQPQLEPDFTVFGEVIEGMDVVQQITPREDPNAPPGDVIETITIEER